MATKNRKAPPSMSRENRNERFPRRHTHQNTPASAVTPRVSQKSQPRCASAPTAPSPLPNRMMKNCAFQNSATRSCEKARACRHSQVAVARRPSAALSTIPP